MLEAMLIFCHFSESLDLYIIQSIMTMTILQSPQRYFLNNFHPIVNTIIYEINIMMHIVVFYNLNKNRHITEYLKKVSNLLFILYYMIY